MSSNSANTYSSFDALNQRLDQIVQEVADESLPLDDVLTLYEEAVNLGLRGCDLLEEGIQSYEEQEVAQGDGQDGQGGQEGAPETGAAPSEAPAAPPAGSSDAAALGAGIVGGAGASASGSAAAAHRPAAGKPSEAQPQ